MHTTGFFAPFLVWIALLLSTHALASRGITFQGVITTPTGAALTVTGATVNLKVLSPNGCILKEENFFGVNIIDGYVNLVVGAGTSGGSDPGLPMSSVFDNSTAKPSLVCVNNDGSINGFLSSYTPSAQDARLLRLDTTLSSDRILVDFNMRSMPFAINSETLNGKSDASFINVNGAQNLNQTNAESIFNRFTKLDAILNNFNSGGTALSASITGNAATATNVTGTVAIANGGTGATSASAARANLGLGTLATISPTGTADATTYLRGDGTWTTVAGGVSSVAGRGGAIVLTTADLSDFNTAADARITAQKAANNGLATLDGTGKVPSTQLALSASDIPNIDYSKITSGRPTTLAGYGLTDAVANLGTGAGNVVTGIQSGNTAGRPAFGTDGRLYIDTQAGIIYRDSGSAWVAVASANGAGGTITSVTAGAGMTGGGSSGAVNLGLGNIAANTILSNTTGSAAVPIANTISQILDGIGATQGSVLYRNAAGWAVLTPGTSGQFLQTQGAAANPQWATASTSAITALTGDVTATGSGSVTATIAASSVNSSKIADGSVGVADLDFAGIMATNTGLLVRNGSQFHNKTCAGNETLIWSVANGWICSSVTLTESDPKVGANTTNMLPKWNGTALVASGVHESAGSVGIGTTSPAASLDVNGGVRVGDDAGACNAGRAGTMKFVGSNLMVCNGTGWMIVQLVAPAANVVLTSGTASGMNVVGPGSPAYGSNVVFTYQNTGTANTATITTSLSNSTNFEFVTDNCNGQILTPTSSCTITLRPKSTADGALAGNLVVNW